MKRIDVDFQSEGTRCAAWLFLPDEAPAGPPPVVLMAHGFGGQREMRLPAFAERFVAEGLAALVFDYRCFGASDGEPRNWIDPSRHRADWRAAIAHARTLGQVDGRRLALWGTSFSGGHVLATATEIPDLAAVVSQVPFVGLDTSNPPPFSVAQALRSLAAGLIDGARGALGLSPFYVQIAGRPDEHAFLNTPDSLDGFSALLPPDSTWRNEAPARAIFSLMRYQPLEHAEDISCPVLLIGAENDSLIPIAAVDAAAKRIPRCEYVRLPGMGHFEPYLGAAFERVSSLEAEFLARHLK